MGIDDDADAGVGVDLDLDLHMGFELDLDVESLEATKARHAQRFASSGDSKGSLEATRAWQA